MLVPWAVLATGLGVADASPAKLLAEARLSLREVLSRVAPSLGSVVGVELRESQGRAVFKIVHAREKRSAVVVMDAKTGEVLGETASSRDYSRVLRATRRTLAEAVDVALGRIEGQAVEAELTVEAGRAVFEVEVFGRSGVFEVRLDAVTGEVIEIEEDDDR